MLNNDRLVQFNVSQSVAETIYATLKDQCRQLHAKARVETDEALVTELRNMADEADQNAESLRQQMREPKPLERSNSGTLTDQRWSKGASCSTSGGATGGSAVIQDRAGLYVAIIALILSTLCLGILFMMLPLVDAKVMAGSAQAEATAREARTTSKVTADKLSELRDHLNSKGLNVPKLD